MTKQKTRAMWLLNHTGARKFEISMLRQSGIDEVFLPKIIPQDINFIRSASVDYSEDAFLTIPEEDLKLLNAADWYRGPAPDVWDIANKHFDVLFFMSFFPGMFANVARHFKGAAIWRIYGSHKSYSFTQHFEDHTRGLRTVEAMGRRFWFGEAYPHLHEQESSFLQSRTVYLPVGIHDAELNDRWQGNDPRLFFICPDIGHNPYYQEVYRDFKTHFGKFPYAVGGAQPLPVKDPNVLGFVPAEQHQRNMCQFRTMFYHSTEPDHIHYHPFEAVRAGMPLVFMAGGLLDRLGGIDLPGRCRSIGEAQRKIRRILDGDRKLIGAIRQSQPCLLNVASAKTCLPVWQSGMRCLIDELEKARTTPRPATTQPKRKRIAVLLSEEYRGGSLRAAILLASAIEQGSRSAGQPVDVVFGHRDNPALYNDEDFADLPGSIARRPFTWRLLNASAAEEAMRYAGHRWIASPDEYLSADDGVKQFCDCDLWVVISDRLSYPLLPLRPYIAMIYDYLQRYENIMPPHNDRPFLEMAHLAERVLVTTRFTASDARDYAGISPDKIRLLPLIAPRFLKVTQDNAPQNGTPAYFLWTTNAAPHKNHANALLALRHYYEVLGGTLKCRVSGVNTRNLLHMDLPHLKPLADIVSNSKALKKNIRWRGDLPDSVYRAHLQNAAFLWHPARIDNGTFSVVEAAHMGVPALSSDYPAMREIDEQFDINLSWMDSANPERMARQLKWMGDNADAIRVRLPTKEKLDSLNDERYPAYWQAVRECL